HRCNRLTFEGDRACGEHPLVADLEAGSVRGGVCGGYHRPYPRHGFGLAGVDPTDSASGDGRAQDGSVNHAGEGHVNAVDGGAADLGVGVLTWGGGSESTHRSPPDTSSTA